MHHSPSVRERLLPIDRAWLRMDEPDNLMIVTGVLFFEPLSLADLRRVLEARLLRVQRFRQRLVYDEGGRAHWQDDPDFDFDRHLLPIELPSPGDTAALQQRVGELMAEPLPHERPLWRFYLVEDHAGGSVLISRLHHAIGDGVALMLVLLSLTDLEPDAVAHDADSSPFSALLDPHPDVHRAAAEKARAVMPEVIGLMSRVAGAARRGKARLAFGMSKALGILTFRSRDARTPLKGPLSTDKRVAWSRPIDLEDIRTIREHTGGTINDVLLTATAGGLRRYLQSESHAVDGLDIRAAVPVSLRNLDQLVDMGNRFGLVFVALPIGIADWRERLAELQRRMAKLKGSYEAPVVLGFLHGMGRSPLFVQRLIERIFGTKATAVMTNVPGPRQRLYLAGRAIRDLIFWVPQSGRLGVGISILSYAGKVRLGVTTDAALVAEPRRIVDGFEAELDDILAAARAAPTDA